MLYMLSHMCVCRLKNTTDNNISRAVMAHEPRLKGGSTNVTGSTRILSSAAMASLVEIARAVAGWCLHVPATRTQSTFIQYGIQMSSIKSTFVRC